MNTEKELGLLFVSSVKFEESDNLSLEEYKDLLNYQALENNRIYVPQILIEKKYKERSKKIKFEIEGSTHSNIAKKVGTYGVAELKSDYDNYFMNFGYSNQFVTFIDTFQTIKFSVEDIKNIIQKQNIDFLYILGKNNVSHFDQSIISVPILNEFKGLKKKYIERLKSDKSKKIKILFWRPYGEKIEIIDIEPKEISDVEEKPKKDKVVKSPTQNIVDEGTYYDELKITNVNEQTNTIFWRRIKNVDNYIIEIIDVDNGSSVVKKTEIKGNLSEYSPGPIRSSQTNRELKVFITAYLKDKSKKSVTYSGFKFKLCN